MAYEVILSIKPICHFIFEEYLLNTLFYLHRILENGTVQDFV